MTDPTTIADDCWAFAVGLYGRPGVAAACLALQTDANVDVMMLLVATFAAARRHIVLDASDIDDMDAACREWRDGIVRPLRALRVALKTGPQSAPMEASERLRAQIKASELAAERIENDLLAGWLARKTLTSPSPSRADVAAVLRLVVKQAMNRTGGTLPEALLNTVNTIVVAAKA
jgi:uncharacterized protein (TIGR02444 family)